MSQNFNIGFVIASFDGGGGPQATQDIMLALKRHNLESRLHSFKGTKNKKINKIFPKLTGFYNAFNFLWKLNKSKPATVIFNSAGLEIGFILAILTVVVNLFSKNKIFFVNIFHNALINPESSRFMNKIRLKISNFIIASSTRFVTVSGGVLTEIHHLSYSEKQRKIITEKGSVIYNAAKQFDFDNCKPANYPFEGQVVLAVGRLCQQKSFDTLIKAHALLKNHNSDSIHLVIVGDGELKSSLQALSKELGTSDSVHFWGYDFNILMHYLSANVFVLSSQHEGFGLVLVEALSCGVPVISTDCPYGPSEILNDGEFGELVPVDNVVLLSQAINKVLSFSTEELQTIKERNIKRARVFNICTLGEKYSKLIDQIIH